ncbi:MAG TPA: CvpA family protein [Bacteroidales bacterium]|nr:CvpA family protein [Bacteroidales bacterium]HRZ48909.1 CvpA family protein [Bacteroidales bacterium]
MNFLDILFVIPLLWFAWKGFSKGLIVEIASLAALIAGIYLAMNFSWYVGGYLGNLFDGNPKYITLAAFAITFLGVVILVQLVGRLVSRSVEKMAMGFLNKLGGAAFSVLKVAFILSILINYYGMIDTRQKLIPPKMREESLLYKPLEKVSPLIAPRLKAIGSEIQESREKETQI